MNEPFIIPPFSLYGVRINNRQYVDYRDLISALYKISAMPGQNADVAAFTQQLADKLDKGHFEQGHFEEVKP